MQRTITSTGHTTHILQDFNPDPDPELNLVPDLALELATDIAL